MMNDHILVIDDEESEAKVYAEELRRSGFHAEFVTHASAGYEALRVKQPDCVVLDARMPEISGFEAAGYIHQRYPDIAIVFLTGKHTSTEDIVHGMQAGAVDYIEKKAKEGIDFPDRIRKAIVAKREQRERDQFVETIARGVAHATIPRLSLTREKLNDAYSSETVEQSRKHLIVAQRNLEYALDIVKRFVHYPTVGEPQEAVEIVSIVKQAVELSTNYQSIMLGPENRLKISVSSVLPPVYVAADPYWLRECICIVLHNAIDAVRDSHLPKIHVSLEIHEFDAIIRIRDNGCGIPAEILENNALFEMRVSSKSTKRYSGRGIGLFFASRVIESISGTITATDLERKTEDFRTEFQFTLPIEHK